MIHHVQKDQILLWCRATRRTLISPTEFHDGIRSTMPTESYGSPGKSGNIIVARNAKHNVPIKKAIASVLSLISISV